MARPRKAKRSSRAQQDSSGRLLEPSNFNFFKLPPEVRALVYEHYFSDEELVLDPRPRACFNRRPLNLSLKMPLLRSNRIVLAEALPVFYRYYLFQIQAPRQGQLTPDSEGWPSPSLPRIRRSEDIRNLIPVLPLITRMELIEPRDWLDDVWDTKMAPHLQILQDHCSNLRFLRFNVLLQQNLSFTHPFSQAHCGSATFCLLAQLTKRLNRLEMIFLHTSSIRVLDICEDIAPRTCWIRDAYIEVPGNRLHTSVWSLQHGRKALADIQISHQSADSSLI